MPAAVVEPASRPIGQSVVTPSHGKITVEECAAEISSMENNKTPGSDGLPKEFYSNFFSYVCTGICGDAESVL